MEVTTRQWRRRLIQAAAELGVVLNDHHSVQFSQYADQLTLWNRRVNLTAIIDPEQMAVKHFVDSLAAHKAVQGCANLIDIGTGAGFPGLPLKIVNTGLQMVLVDSVRKKTSFVNHIIRCLALTGVRAVNARIEALSREQSFHSAFNVVTCRALTDLERIIQLSLPLLAHHGRIIAYQGPKQILEERAIAAMVRREQKKIGAETEVRVSLDFYRLPIIDETRILVVIDL